MPGNRSPRASVCRPCRRAQRRGRTEHSCYGAVLGEDRVDATTWVACGCECQRTLVSLGFFDLDGTPPAEQVPQAAAVEAQPDRRGPEPGSPLSR